MNYLDFFRRRMLKCDPKPSEILYFEVEQPKFYKINFGNYEVAKFPIGYQL